jgi:hypothetical protein
MLPINLKLCIGRMETTRHCIERQEANGFIGFGRETILGICFVHPSPVARMYAAHRHSSDMSGEFSDLES